MNHYQKTIIEATGCEPDDAPIIEEYLSDIFKGYSLRIVKCSEFCEAAKKAYSDILWMRSPKWAEYMNLLN
jgi:hypothetical protein